MFRVMFRTKIAESSLSLRVFRRSDLMGGKEGGRGRRPPSPQERNHSD